MIKILYQGTVQVTSEPYWLVGGDEIVGFYFDVDRRAYIDSYSYSFGSQCPTISLSSEDTDYSTELEFTNYPGWTFHSSSGGKTIAVALVKDRSRDCAAEAAAYNKAKETI